MCLCKHNMVAPHGTDISVKFRSTRFLPAILTCCFVFTKKLITVYSSTGRSNSGSDIHPACFTDIIESLIIIDYLSIEKLYAIHTMWLLWYTVLSWSTAFQLTLLCVDKKNQLDVTFCILYLSSNSCSTCFGQPCTHHQELTTAWCYSLVLVCAVATGRLSRPVVR